MKKHFLSLDALRGVAAFCVVLLHLRSYFGNSNPIPHAYLAVDFFFILSGFVIAYSYEERILGGWPWTHFMVRRLIRLYPLMLAGLVAGGSYYLLQRHLEPDRGEALRVIFEAFIAGLFLVPAFPLGRIGGFPLNGPAWSLCFELLANALYAFLGPQMTNRMLVAFILVSGAALGLLAYFSLWIGNAEIWGFGAMGCARVGFSFFLGVGLYRWFKLRKRRTRFILGHPLITAALLLIIFSAPDGWSDYYNLFVTGLVFPAVVLASANYEPRGAAAVVAKWGGWLSFPLYAVHMPISMLAMGTLKHFNVYAHLQGPLRGIVIVAAVTTIAAALALCYDGPTRRWLTRECVTDRQSRASTGNQPSAVAGNGLGVSAPVMRSVDHRETL